MKSIIELPHQAHYTLDKQPVLIHICNVQGTCKVQYLYCEAVCVIIRRLEQMMWHNILSKVRRSQKGWRSVLSGWSHT